MSITYKRPPTIDVRITESSAAARYLTGVTNENTPVDKLIRYISAPKFTVSACPDDGASIKSITVKCGAGGAPFNVVNGGSYTFSWINSGDFVVTATDSNGMTSVKNISFDSSNGGFVEFFNAHITPTLYRSYIQDPEAPAPNEAVLNIKGSYYNGSFGNPNGKTDIKIKYRYRISGGSWPFVDSYIGDSGWTLISGYTLSGGNISTNPDIVLGTNFDYTKSYEFEFVICEYVNGELIDYKVSNCILPAGIPAFDWGESDFNINVDLKWKEKNFIGVLFDLIYPVGSVVYFSGNTPTDTWLPAFSPLASRENLNMYWNENCWSKVESGIENVTAWKRTSYIATNY